ncbi:hypothetical protein clP1_022 [Pediococcus phage cIP1]|uniref:Uncharacterized protein n=1 Tax=Pediococcus phage cIP1 TaxID=2681621 RepID=G8FV05_9CAUD|nr:hypothetical protein clP1_022 [Pediococcus phage cIP1]AER59781.1 unknown [Pediococcus phage cIP1]
MITILMLLLFMFLIGKLLAIAFNTVLAVIVWLFIAIVALILI